MTIITIYLIGLIITFLTLSIIIKIGGMNDYKMCLKWAIIWFLIPFLLIILVGCMILLAVEDIKENERM